MSRSAAAALERVIRRLPGYESRPQQAAMATGVADAISAGEHFVVEAGTGSGKSFAYLVPILESGKKAVVSTGTIALQEQLLKKDIPFLREATGREIRVALAKGRGNYICLRKLHEVDQSLGIADPDRQLVSELIGLSRDGGWNGDRGELPFIPNSAFWNSNLASDGEDCLGPRCGNFAFTPHRVARAACDDAEIVIANHSLYFTDLVTGAGVLPAHEVVVFDEAHQLERAATSALTVSIGRWSLAKLTQRVQRRFPNLPTALHRRLSEGEAASCAAVYRYGQGQFPLVPDAELEAAAATLAEAIAALGDWLAGVDLREMRLLDDDAAQALQRAETQREQMTSVARSLARRWEHFASLAPEDPAATGRANWLRVEPERDYYELHSAPLEIGDSLREALWNKRTCILTSATLAVDGRFDYLRRTLGIDEGNEAVLGSPFEFEEQALLYLPTGLPSPNDPAYTDAIVPLIETILHCSGGRAFVLFTSYKALRQVAAELGPRLPYPWRTQDDLPRQRLLEWFRSTPGSVLFATATFWEGVDVPGDALSCVIIDRLPFASPDDPIVQAQTERMRQADEDWFNGYMLPRAVLALKQGFGRLIRTRTDTGLVAILDPRLVSMRYGQVILRSLPPARQVRTLPDSLDAAFAGWRTTAR